MLASSCQIKGHFFLISCSAKTNSFAKDTDMTDTGLEVCLNSLLVEVVGFRLDPDFCFF